MQLNCTENRELKELRESFRKTEPSIKYKVGDRVQHGSIEESIIIEILDDGRILKLHENYIHNNYGNKIKCERDMYVAWHDVVPYHSIEEEINIPLFTQRNKIRFNFSQRNLSCIFTNTYRFGLDNDPPYQRGYVWDLQDKEALIDSIFKQIEIGKFVFIKNPYKDNSPSFEVLDGKQRIGAIIDFYENRFTYKGFYFYQLRYSDQCHFEDYTISVAEIDELSEKQKIEYFLRLNTFGKPQDEAHLSKIKDLFERS